MTLTIAGTVVLRSAALPEPTEALLIGAALFALGAAISRR